MPRLIYKKVGWFADELSARYEATVSPDVTVRIFKDDYMKGFRFEFLTSDLFDLGDITGNYLSSFWNGATMQEAIERVEEIISDPSCFDEIEEKAIQVKARMQNITPLSKTNSHELQESVYD